MTKKMVCIKRNAWKTVGGQPTPFRSPNYLEQVTPIGHVEFDGRKYLYLDEFATRGPAGGRVMFRADNFRPLVHDQQEGKRSLADMFHLHSKGNVNVKA